MSLLISLFAASKSLNATTLCDQSAIEVSQCQNTSSTVSYWSHSMPKHFVISQLLKSFNARTLRDHQLLKSPNAKTLRDQSSIKSPNTKTLRDQSAIKAPKTSWSVSYWSHTIPKHFVFSQLLKSLDTKTLRVQSAIEVTQYQNTSRSVSY
jgi:hypothetical protein